MKKQKKHNNQDKLSLNKRKEQNQKEAKASLNALK